MREEEKLGLNSSSTADIRIDGVRVAAIACSTRSARDSPSRWRRSTAGASASLRRPSASRRRHYDTARAYAPERRQFGRRIAEFQAIQFALAEMATSIDAARLLTYRAAWRKQAGAAAHAAEGAKAKLFASRVAVETSSSAIQVLGGYGYTKEFPVERYYRDAKVTEIYEGTSEIQRIVIARQILQHQERLLPVGAV